jgi:hypothetical protein
MIKLDASKIYKEGQNNWRQMPIHNAIIYILIEYNIINDMEGFFHFFLYDHHFEKLPLLKQALAEIGDDDYLIQLTDFEETVIDAGYSFNPTGIEEFWLALDASDSLPPESWQKAWYDGIDKRWDLAKTYLVQLGFSLEL